MIKIGLIGEDPTDTGAIKHLMKQKFDEGFHFFALANNKTGSQIFNPPAVKTYNFKIQKENPKHVIVIIDADATITEDNKIREKKEKYNKLKQQLSCDSILLLNIYELEALILADIDSFNIHYNCKVKFAGNILHKEEPKEYLKRESKKYKESHCPDLFASLKFDTIVSKCAYFKDFITNFEKAIAN